MKTLLMTMKIMVMRLLLKKRRNRSKMKLPTLRLLKKKTTMQSRQGRQEAKTSPSSRLTPSRSPSSRQKPSSRRSQMPLLMPGEDMHISRRPSKASNSSSSGFNWS